MGKQTIRQTDTPKNRQTCKHVETQGRNESIAIMKNKQQHNVDDTE